MTAQLDGPHRSSRGLPSVAARGAVGFLLLALPLAICTAGCGSDQERAATHLERADRLLADGRQAEAMLELGSALQRDPENLEATRRLAQIELRRGDYEAGVDHLKQAYRLAPENTEVTLELARGLQLHRPNEARVLIDAVVAREPENVSAYLALSDLELSQGRTERALREARQAMQVAPDDPLTHFQYGYAVLGKIRHAQLLERPPDATLLEATIAAFERYIEKGGSHPWNARIEQARVMVTLPGRRLEALALYRSGVEQMFEQAEAAERLGGALRSAQFAEQVGDDDLFDWSLGKILSLRPKNIEAWVALVAVRKRRGQSADDVVFEMVAQHPTNPRAHIERARHMISQRKLADALAYLEEKALDPDIEAPPLLGAIANTQLAARRPEEAERMVQRLEREYPDHPRTTLERAQLDLRAGKVPKALESLRRLIERFESKDAYRLLAHAEELSGNADAAISAITSAIQSGSGFSYTEQRIRARLLAENGRCPSAIKNLIEIQERTPLSNEDKILLALCRYETGNEAIGRHLLEEILDQPWPPAEAAIQYARREGPSQGVTGRAYGKLEQVLRRHPRNWQAILELARLDRAAGRIQEALAHFDDGIAADPEATPARAWLLRAHLRVSADDPAGAILDATAAVEADPRLPGALELLVSLYVAQGQPEEAIAAIQQAGRLVALDAKRHSLLGELHRAQGQEDLALQSFENALAAGSQRPVLKNDVAFMLAKRGRDLDRALQLAREATLQLMNNPNAVDTLGYIYLQSGDTQTALTHFEDAVERAATPQPSFYYHLGLALRSLGRNAEATRAFEKALEIGEEFPEAADARQALDGTVGAGAS